MLASTMQFSNNQPSPTQQPTNRPATTRGGPHVRGELTFPQDPTACPASPVLRSRSTPKQY
jgi:hypothetical protein